VKLVLANNQSARFIAFYKSLQDQSREPFDYTGYSSLFFGFDNDAVQPIVVKNLAQVRDLSDYDGVYINNYLNTYELAATVAICCQVLGVPFIDREFEHAPSLSKLTAYARLVASGVRIPKTVAGTKAALLQAAEHYPDDLFPAVLKRADADRGLDNFKVVSQAEVADCLAAHDERSLWILQQYIDNDGFYRVSFYNQQPAFCIFRSLAGRADNNAQKAHIFKPQGGANASLIELATVPAEIIDECQRAINALNRQVAGVDCLFDPITKRVYILEVNYNPQLVTIETFKDVRVNAFLADLNRDWRLPSK
jgi:glutathione synthase/RimK-type ligase-like ATP-grasp enzyme